jgi:Transaldolase/Fructose-6-phosphate aldolase
MRSSGDLCWIASCMLIVSSAQERACRHASALALATLLRLMTSSLCSVIRASCCENQITLNIDNVAHMVQGVACAQAKASLISPFVGRILDWFKKKEGVEGYPAPQDPGVVAVKKARTFVFLMACRALLCAHAFGEVRACRLYIAACCSRRRALVA